MNRFALRQITAAWFSTAFGIVAVTTALRLALLAFNRTDLFSDEAQYWLWGHHFAFGYYSKPPMIAYVIGAVTTLARSDAAFWIRMPGAVLHGLTALILSALANRLAGRGAAIWTAAIYVTLPMVAVGSLLISTDTIMAPFFAAGILFYHRLLCDHRKRDAVMVGGMIGCACMAKYAGIYLPAGMLLAAVLRADLRLRLPEVALIALPAAALVLPNLIWNLGHGWVTMSHTAQNIGWIEQRNPFAAIRLANMADFLASQFGMCGPVVFMAMLVGFWRFRKAPFLVGLSLPALAIVTLQSVLQVSNANWAAPTYFAGSVLAVTVLAKHRQWRLIAVATNTALSLALPLLTVMPDLRLGTIPLLNRYLGRAEVSVKILELAKREGVGAVVSNNRDVMADLFYTGRGAALPFYTPRPRGKPANYYEQTYPVPADLTGRVLLITDRPPACAAVLVLPDLQANAYCRLPMAAYTVSAKCARDLPSSKGCK